MVKRQNQMLIAESVTGHKLPHEVVCATHPSTTTPPPPALTLCAGTACKSRGVGSDMKVILRDTGLRDVLPPWFA